MSATVGVCFVSALLFLATFYEIKFNNDCIMPQANTVCLIDEERIDYLFNNAGVMSKPYELTVDGNETHFQVNYLSKRLGYTFDIPQFIHC